MCVDNFQTFLYLFTLFVEKLSSSVAISGVSPSRSVASTLWSQRLRIADGTVQSPLLPFGCVQEVCTRNVTTLRRSFSCNTDVTNLEVQDTDFLDTPIWQLPIVWRF